VISRSLSSIGRGRDECGTDPLGIVGPRRGPAGSRRCCCRRTCRPLFSIPWIYGTQSLPCTMRFLRSETYSLPVHLNPFAFLGLPLRQQQQPSQQTASQPEMLTQNPDLTQTFGDFGDDDEEDDLLLSPYLESSQEFGEGCGVSSSTRRRIRRRRAAPPMPWGRLVPCGGGAGAGGGAVSAAGEGGSGGDVTRGTEPPLLAPIDLMPRPAKPQQPVYDDAAAAAEEPSSLANGRRSISAAGTNSDCHDGGGDGGDDDEDFEGPRPGDVFNEYVIGRSAKCDVVVPRQAVVHHHQAGTGGGAGGAGATTADKNHKLSEWVYALVSNKHTRIYCLQSAAASASSSSIGAGPTTRGYEVYVEDTSHNGTVVNGTVLRKCERRILNSGTFWFPLAV
jgi:FHA domain